MQKQSITSAEFSAKFKSKKEVYNFLTIDCHAYLCCADNVTIYFLKDLISGKKKCKLTSLYPLTIFSRKLRPCETFILPLVWKSNDGRHPTFSKRIPYYSQLSPRRKRHCETSAPMGCQCRILYCWRRVCSLGQSTSRTEKLEADWRAWTGNTARPWDRKSLSRCYSYKQ